MSCFPQENHGSGDDVQDFLEVRSVGKGACYIWASGGKSLRVDRWREEVTEMDAEGAITAWYY